MKKPPLPLLEKRRGVSAVLIEEGIPRSCVVIYNEED
jgi:hypothetical protein